MYPRDMELLKKRLKVVNACLAAGTGLTAAAAKLGLSAPGLSQYLDKAGYRELRIELGAATRIGMPLSEEEHIKRLTAVVECGSQAAAARKLGVTPPAMCKWLKDNGYGPNFKADLLELTAEDDI